MTDQIHPTFAGLGPRPQTSEHIPRGRPKNSPREERHIQPIPNQWGLSRSEAYVIMRRADGDELHEIAAEMCIAVKTASTYSTRAVEKMGAKNPVHAALMWDREFRMRPTPLSYDEVMEATLGRPPTEIERSMNLRLWEAQPEVFKYALAVARQRVAESPELAQRFAANRLAAGT
jgi:DNA-binding CsgD family transcriptional regulator